MFYIPISSKIFTLHIFYKLLDSHTSYLLVKLHKNQNRFLRV